MKSFVVMKFKFWKWFSCPANNFPAINILSTYYAALCFNIGPLRLDWHQTIACTGLLELGWWHIFCKENDLQNCFSSSIDKTRVEQNTAQCFASFYSLTKKSDFSTITVTHSSGHKICMFERWQLWPVKEFNFHQIADNDPLLTAIQRWLDNQLFANFQQNQLCSLAIKFPNPSWCHISIHSPK